MAKPFEHASRTEGGGRGGANDGHHGPKVNLLRPLSLDLRLRVWAVGNFWGSLGLRVARFGRKIS